MESTISSLTVREILREIKDEIEGKYLSKVQQLDEDTYRFRFSPGSTDLIIEPGKRLNITHYRLKAPKKPYQSSMVLRKHLSNSKLSEITQKGFDRIVKMAFTNGKKVIAELFAEGNLVLTDEDDKILYAHNTREWSDRKIRGGEKYKYPSSTQLLDPYEADLEEFKETLSGESVVVNLASGFGLGGDIAEEICREAGIEKGKELEELTEDETRELYGAMEKVLNREKNPVKQDKEIRPFPLKGEVQETYDSLNKAVDENYTEKERETEEPEELVKLRKRLKNQEESIEEFKKKSKRNKEKGDMIYRHHSEIGRAIQLYKEGKKQKLDELNVSVENGKLVFDLE